MTALVLVVPAVTGVGVEAVVIIAFIVEILVLGACCRVGRAPIPPKEYSYSK
jgi:hypothetical protein